MQCIIKSNKRKGKTNKDKVTIKSHTQLNGLTLYLVPNEVAICRNLGHGGTAIKRKEKKKLFSFKRENKGSFPFKGKQRSRHQHLFMENVGKTKK